MGLCESRVVVVTGAGRGLGRSHAMTFAAEGAHVVVNDLGSAVDGSGHDADPASTVVDEIRSAGGVAIANHDDVADWDGARRLIQTALDEFGRIDVLVNNVGILRDRTLVSMSESDWDAVVRVHLRGTFCPTRHAAVHWRDRAKAGDQAGGRIINTSSPAGLYGNFGQTNYGAAKAGIAALTAMAALELGRYGVTANAISPSARTRMTESLIPENPAGVWDRFDPANVSALVAWLGSEESAHVTGRVFDVFGGRLRVETSWLPGPEHLWNEPFDAEEFGPIVEELLAAAPKRVRNFVEAETGQPGSEFLLSI